MSVASIKDLKKIGLAKKIHRLTRQRKRRQPYVDLYADAEHPFFLLQTLRACRKRLKTERLKDERLKTERLKD